MIELRTPLGSFDLAPDTTVSIVDINNAMEWDTDISVTRTYPFRLPWTPGNAHKWKHADKLDALGDILSLPAELIINGDLELAGRVYLLQTQSGKSYSVQVSPDKETINSDKKLPEFDYGGLWGAYGPTEPDYFFWTVHPETLKDKRWPEVALALPMVKQPNLTYDYLNHYNLTLDEYRGGTNAVVPMFYLGWIMEKIAATMGLRFAGSFYSDEELQKVIVFNMHQLNIYGYDQDPLDPKEHMPNITLKQLLASMRIRWGMGVHIDLQRQEMYIYTCRDMLRNTKELDVTYFISGEQPQDIRPKSEEVNYKQEFDSEDELKTFWKPEEEIKLKGTVVELVDLYTSIPSPVKGDIYLVEEEDYNYIFQGTNWVRHSYRYYHYQPNNFSTVSDQSSSLITSKSWDTFNGVEVKTPECLYDKTEFDRNAVNAGLRYLIYHGMRTATGTALQYPMASIDHKDVNMTNIGNMELRDDGEYGLVNRYKQYRSRLRGAVRFPSVYLNNKCAGKIQELRPDVMVRIEGNLFAWTEKTRVYTMDGLRTVELKLARI